MVVASSGNNNNNNNNNNKSNYTNVDPKHAIFFGGEGERDVLAGLRGAPRPAHPPGRIAYYGALWSTTEPYGALWSPTDDANNKNGDGGDGDGGDGDGDNEDNGHYNTNNNIK